MKTTYCTLIYTMLQDHWSVYPQDQNKISPNGVEKILLYFYPAFINKKIPFYTAYLGFS